MQQKSVLEKLSHIRVHQYVLQEEGLNSWWDFRMSIEDFYVTLFELINKLKRTRFVFRALMVAKRYFRIDINKPTEVIEYKGVKWFVEKFGLLLVIGEVDVNKIKPIVEEFENNWKMRYPKLRNREIQKYINSIKNEDLEEMKRIWYIFIKVVNER